MAVALVEAELLSLRMRPETSERRLRLRGPTSSFGASLVPPSVCAPELWRAICGIAVERTFAGRDAVTIQKTNLLAKQTLPIETSEPNENHGGRRELSVLNHKIPRILSVLRGFHLCVCAKPNLLPTPVSLRVVALVRQLLHICAIGQHSENLVGARSMRLKDDMSSVGGPAGIVVAS